ncbi:MAG: manganese efflux pump [Candidatus Caldarchaeales archaeon]
MDYLTLILLSLGLSLDDFGIAFALSLLTLGESFRIRMAYAGKIAVAFSISTALLPLIGWIAGLMIYGWVAVFDDWIVLIVFCGVGLWIIKEAFEDEKLKSVNMFSSSFWMLVATGVFGSLDESVLGVSYPFLDISIPWIITAVILANTALVYMAMLLSIWIRGLSKRFTSILSGSILILLGIMNFIR